MPVLGAATSSSTGYARVRRGAYVPDGSLDVWRAARNNHATARTEVVIFGDSTTFGSSSGPVPFYSWTQKVRALSIAAGYTDGGRGIAGISDTAALSGPENIPIVQSINPAGSWVAAGDGNDVLLTETPNSSTNGATIVFQGYGTAARLHYTKMSTCGTFTYAIDGGAAVSVNANFNGYTADSIYLTLGGTDTTLHTITVANTGTSQQARVVPEFLKTNGIVYHKQAISGLSTSSYFNTVNPNLGNYQAQIALGITSGVTAASTVYGWQQPAAAKPQYRNPSLAICALGTNDLQGSTVANGGLTTNAEQDAVNEHISQVQSMIGNFVRLARAAGADPLLIVPHYDIAANAHPLGGQYAAMSWATGMAHGCAVIDFNEAIRPMTTMVARGLGTPNVHADYRTYDAEATFLWANALSL